MTFVCVTVLLDITTQFHRTTNEQIAAVICCVYLPSTILHPPPQVAPWQAHVTDCPAAAYSAVFEDWTTAHIVAVVVVMLVVLSSSCSKARDHAISSSS